MSTRDGNWIAIDDLTGGLNTSDPPLSLPANQVVAAQNIDWYRSSCGRKRAGTVNVATTDGPLGDVLSLIRHLPAADETTGELWAMDSASIIKAQRLAGGTAWESIGIADNPIAAPSEVYGASFNGKLFLAYDSGVDRLHVWDGMSVRRVGLATPAAPSVANGGIGPYPAIVRYYQVTYAEISGTTVVRRSERSAATSFTPSGAGINAQITKPAAISEGETHWEVWGSADGVSYYLLFVTVVGTTTVQDTQLPAEYGTQAVKFPDGSASVGTLAPLVGENVPPGSAKYLLVDEDRLLMAGNWEDTAKSSIIEFTPVGGDKDIGDDERVPVTSQRKLRLNVDRRSGGAITGMGRAFSTPFVFKYSAIYRLIRTGNAIAPYVPRTISTTKGAISQRGITVGEDEAGREALYFFDRTGPYRADVNEVQWMGRDNLPVWKRVNLDATTPVIALYYAELKQVWFYLALDGASTPNSIFVFDVARGVPTREGIRGGWSQYTMPAPITSAVMFSNTLGAGMSGELKPYVGMASGVLRKADTGVDDAGTGYQAFVTTKPLAPVVTGSPDRLSIGVKGGVTGVVVEGEAAAGTSALPVAVVRDYGVETVTKTVSLVPALSEPRVTRPVTALEMTEAQILQVTIGDTAPSASTWNVDRIGLKLRRESDVL